MYGIYKGEILFSSSIYIYKGFCFFSNLCEGRCTKEVLRVKEKLTIHLLVLSIFTF